MKRFLILIPLSLFAAEVVDRGILSPRLLLPLEKCGRYGTNFVLFEIEAVQYRESGTNSFRFKTTNEFLILNDFIVASVPDGPTHLFIRERCGDGSVSAYTEALVQLVRNPPSKPRIGKPIQMSVETSEQRVEDILKAKADVESVSDLPPMPPGFAAPYVSPVPLRVQPLPGGTNISHEQFQLKFKNEIAEGKRRRSQ